MAMWERVQFWPVYLIPPGKQHLLGISLLMEDALLLLKQDCARLRVTSAFFSQRAEECV